jgi:3'-phosphoadenosine 5'-phosphosulfate sulfotransferase (PAPS reductase)/FAD synthetase
MDLEKKSIERLKIASEMSLQYYKKPLLVTYSGGKDSDVQLELTIRSGIPFELQNSHTTADAPQTVQHIKDIFKRVESTGTKCTIDKPRYKGNQISMWSLIPIKLIPPTRRVRYCCQVLKEGAGDGRMIATGIRWDESTQRSNRGELEIFGSSKKNKIILTNDNDDKRRFFEKCEARAKSVCNPIIDWKSSDIWDYVNSEKLIVNELYKCGFDRVGCIGCPMAASTKRYFGFAMFPKYKQMYINSFERMVLARKSRGLETEWNTGEDVFSWWMNEDINQMTLDFENEED